MNEEPSVILEKAMTKNIASSLKGEIKIGKKVVAQYIKDGGREGNYSLLMLKRSIKHAEEALKKGDPSQVITCYMRLTGKIHRFNMIQQASSRTDWAS